jgi:hypothetical protein
VFAEKLTDPPQIKDVTLENTHGKFLGPDGGELPW